MFKNNIYMVIFKEEDHSYRNRYNGNKYISVTTFIKDFYEPYDESYWLRYKACEAMMGGQKKDSNGKYLKLKGFYTLVMKSGLDIIEKTYLENKRYHEIIEEIRLQWKTNNKESTDKGTEYHLNKEKELIDSGVWNGLKVHPKPKGYDNISREMNEDGVYPELLLFNNKYMIAGQSDRVIKEGNYVDILDYKTNKKLEFESYKHKKMFEPFEKFDDCSFNHYSIQLSLYGFMLEDFGYTVRKIEIEHKDKMYPVNFCKDEVYKALEIKRGHLSPLKSVLN